MPKLSRRWAGIAGAGLTLACLAFFGLQLRGLLSDGDFDLQSSLPLIPASLAAFLVAFAAFSIAWHLLLLTVGARPAIATSTGVFATTQFGKYLPGNVGHHVGRVALSTSLGLPADAVMVTMIAEVAIVFAWMGVLGLPLLDFWLVRLDIDGHRLAMMLCTLVAGGAMTALVAWRLFRRHARFAAAVGSLHLALKHALRSPVPAASAATLILFGILATSLSLALLDPARALPTAALFPAVAGLFAAAWLLGFVTPGAPAGIGIREVVLTEGLAPLIGRDQSLLVALLFRIVSTLADFLVFLAGLCILWWDRRRVRRLPPIAP